MELYLLRHGDAVDRATGGYKRDEDRPLTGEGEDEVRQAAGALLKLGVALDLVLTSPLVRARQTADLVADALAPKRGVEVSQALAPGGRPEAILRAVVGVGPVERVLLTGHMPDLGALAGWLAWGQDAPTIPLRTAGLCRVDLPDHPTPGSGDLRWLLPPRLLRRLA